MESYANSFAGKRVTQMGLGTLGRGVGDARYLAEAGAELLVTDLKDEVALAESVEQLSGYSNVTLRLGEHREEDFTGCDLVLKGAGVPFDSPYISHARATGVPVDMSASLFVRMTDVPIIGVTGTRGKSTVTHLIHAILRVDERRVLLGGNVRGVSNLSLLNEVEGAACAVFELDSWQCQGFAEERSLDAFGVRQGTLSPAVAAFTSFMPDHMNYYRGDMERYFKDKAQIFLHQSEGDLFVVGRQLYDMLKPYRSRIRARVVVADETDVPETWNVRLKGAHNRYNIGIAVAVCREYGVPMETIRRAVEAFESLPGRMQYVGEMKGVQVYNDTNATTPDAVAATLHALAPPGEKRVILIAGGVDKGLEPSPMIEAIHGTCKYVVLLPGSGTDRLRAACDNLNTTNCSTVADMQEAVDVAWQAIRDGDVLVLSPGFASHNLFKNEYDRGDQFLYMITQ